MMAAPHFRDRPLRFAIGACAGLVAIVALGFGAKSVWKLRKTTLAVRYAVIARDASKRREWKAAEAAIMAAHRLNPKHPEVLRSMAEFYSEFNNPEAASYWSMLEATGTMSPADRLGYVRLALRLRQPDLAKRALSPFYLQFPENREGLGLVSEIFEQEGNHAQALAAARDVISRGTNDPAAEFRLARLELGSQMKADWQKGRIRMFGLLATSPDYRGLAGIALLAHGLLTPSERTLIGTLVPSAPTNSFEDRLVHLALALQKFPDLKRETVKRFATDNDLKDVSPRLIAAAEQMSAVGDFQAVVEFVSDKLAMLHPTLFRLRLGALGATGALAEMEHMLEHPSPPIPQAQHLIYQAGLAQMANRTNDALPLWNRALAASQRSAVALEFLAQHAEFAHATNIAVGAWKISLQDPLIAARAAKEMIRLGTSTRDPQAIHVALDRIVQLNPQDTESKLALAYCQLLLQTDEAAARETLAAGREAFQNRDFYQIVVALDALRLKEVERAMGAIEDPSLGWDNSPVSWRVVRAATLGRAGLSSKAREAAATLKPEELSAQEMELVRAWLPDARQHLAEP